MQGCLVLAMLAWGVGGETPPYDAAPRGEPLQQPPLLAIPDAASASAQPAWRGESRPAPTGGYRPGDLRHTLQRMRDGGERTAAAPAPTPAARFEVQQPAPAAQPQTHPNANWPVRLAGYSEESPATVDSGNSNSPPVVSADSTSPEVLPPGDLSPALSVAPPMAATGSLPPRREPIALAPPGRGRDTSGDAPRVPTTSGSLVTVIASLAIVLGLFFVVIWLFRRAAGNGPAALPSDAVAVLGQTPLTARQNVHLLRIANKLLLVCSNGETAATLTEITDTADVERIAALCVAAQPGSVTNSFRDILTQLGSEPAQPGFLGTSGGSTGGPFAGLGLIGDDD